jgi:hypothetical protein
MEKGPDELSDDDLLTGPLAPALVASIPGTMAVELHCPKCTGPMMKCAVGHVAIYGWWLERETRGAGTLGPPRTATSDVSARTCVRCGFTELYATDPTALLSGDEAN